MFTIKSISKDGEYYLVKDWDKNKCFWEFASELKREDMYSTEAAAKGALTKLLKTMYTEYGKDEFFIVETDDNDKIIREEPYRPDVKQIVIKQKAKSGSKGTKFTFEKAN